MRRNLLAASCLLLFSFYGFAQHNNWTKYHGKTIENVRERSSIPTEYQLLKLNIDGITQQLQSAPAKGANVSNGTAIKIPNQQGTFDTYRVFEASTMHPDLQAKYPSIKSYTGFKEGDNTTKIRFSLSPYFGFNAVIRSTEGINYIDSYAQDNSMYIMYNRNSVEHVHTFECKHGENDHHNVGFLPEIDLGENTVIDGKLRKYRLALATTIEYTAYIAQQAGVGSGTDAQKIAATMEALNLAVSRLNEVYENDLSVTMELVPNNDLLIHINSDTYNPMDAGAMLGQNQTRVDAVIGNANYDIGHVFFRATAGNDNGVAYLRSSCNNSLKAGGVTGAGNPVGDPFVIDYVAHEMGHQYGANHTQNNSCNRNAATAVEPGSASTIMGYAGICHPNVQNNSDAYFHAVSVREMYLWVTSGNGDCAAKTDTNNSEPIVDAGPDRTIPKETPFALVGTASDADGDNLTYNWEQIDNQTAQMPPRPTNTGGPMFRSKWATDSPEKFFPSLPILIEGYNPNINTPGNFRAWEKLPAVARTMNFAFLVRDNNPVGGQTGRDDIRLTVTADAGPFVVTSQNASGEVWNLGESKTITWDVANTNVAPVNTTDVKILISTDGGLTFPHVLVESTPNNGSYTFTVPAGLGVTQDARIMIRAIDNVFLNVNEEDFTINSNMSVQDLQGNQMDIYPNPSNGIFTIELNKKANNASYKIFNMEGRVVASSKISSSGFETKQQVNVSHLPNGTYVVQVENGAETFSKKLIIKK